MLRNFIETLSAIAAVSVIAGAALLAATGDRLIAGAEIDAETSGPLLIRAQQVGDTHTVGTGGTAPERATWITAGTPALGS